MVNKEMTGLNKSTEKISVANLPVYDEPLESKFQFIEYKMSNYDKGVSVVRRSVWQYSNQLQDYIDMFRDKFETSKAHTKHALHYIQEDSSTIPRATIITVAGLGGVVAGYRGGAFRKSIFAATAMLATASVCYPHQAVDISRLGWTNTKTQFSALYNRNFSEMGVKKSVTERTEELSKKEFKTKNKDKLITNVSMSESNSQTPKRDTGMSRKEDMDLYSTRGNN